MRLFAPRTGAAPSTKASASQHNTVSGAGLRRLAIALLLLGCATAMVAQSVHQYADSAACQMGAREGNYLPQSILPGDGKNEFRIPITWSTCPAGKPCRSLEVVWKQTDTGKGEGFFGLIDASKGCTRDAPCKIENNYPEDGVVGPFEDPLQSGVAKCKGGTKNQKRCTADAQCRTLGGFPFKCEGNKGEHLKCDHFPLVDPSCAPDQYVKSINQGVCEAGANPGKTCSADADCGGAANSCGLVLWHVLFRRSAAAAKVANAPGDWGPSATLWYDVVDAIGLKANGNGITGTYGAVFLDDLKRGASQDFNMGIRAGALPRPGGKRPDLRKEGLRAARWFDTPAQMNGGGGSCNNCHGTPFNGFDWIRPGATGRPRDDRAVWWHAGNDQGGFPNKIMFRNAKSGGTTYNCTGCHTRWMTGSGSTPGADIPLARYITMVHDANVNNPFKSVPSLDGDDKYREFASSFRTDKPQGMFLDKNATQTHYMPPDHGENTVKKWRDAFDEQYNGVACCGKTRAVAPWSDPTGTPVDCATIMCTGTLRQDLAMALFQTPWMLAKGITPVKLDPGDAPNGTQKIAAPDAPDGTTLTYPVACPGGSGAGPGDQCFKLAWNDPALNEEFNAPQTFHYKTIDQSLQAGKPNPIPDFTYCYDNSNLLDKGMKEPDTFTIPGNGIFPQVKEAAIVDPCDPQTRNDCWRYSYETYGVVKKCKQTWLHICGGWCQETIKIAGDPAGVVRVSTEKGGDDSFKMKNENGLPKGKLNLGDGTLNFHFNGTHGKQITVLIPPQYCNGGTCKLANGSASGTGALQSSGSYTISSSSNAPFSLTANQDGSFTVNQTVPINFSYSSMQGTLTGTLQLASVSATNGNGQSTVLGTFTATGGTFAQYFPVGANLNATLGLTGSLGSLVGRLGFVSAEFRYATLEPVPDCPKSDDQDFNETASYESDAQPEQGHR